MSAAGSRPQRAHGNSRGAAVSIPVSNSSELTTIEGDARRQILTSKTLIAVARRLVRNEVERVRLDEVAHRVVATSVVPYPPGIPMMMPGESAGPADGPYIGYLRALRDWDRRFPGFAHETHGVEVDGGEHYLRCLTHHAG
jgi:arginine/lysine/ornithine decarboxylase